MTVLLTICIIACFIVSFLAFIYPIIPGILAVWAGYLIYHFGINGGELTISFWIIQAIFTLFIFVADFIANGYFLKNMEVQSGANVLVWFRSLSDHSSSHHLV